MAALFWMGMLRFMRSRPTVTDQTPPTPPPGWGLIAPADATLGDSVILPDGRIESLGSERFAAYPVEIRRRTWAIRRIDQSK